MNSPNRKASLPESGSAESPPNNSRRNSDSSLSNSNKRIPPPPPLPPPVRSSSSNGYKMNSPNRKESLPESGSAESASSNPRRNSSKKIPPPPPLPPPFKSSSRGVQEIKSPSTANRKESLPESGSGESAPNNSRRNSDSTASSSSNKSGNVKNSTPQSGSGIVHTLSPLEDSDVRSPRRSSDSDDSSPSDPEGVINDVPFFEDEDCIDEGDEYSFPCCVPPASPRYPPNPRPPREWDPSVLPQETNIPDSIGALCKRCGREVYLAEMRLSSRGVYHTECYTCCLCGKSLDAWSVTEYRGEVFCKGCYRRNFSLLGAGYGVGAGVLQTR